MSFLVRIVVNAFSIWIVTLIPALGVTVIPFAPGETLQLVLTLLLVALIFALVNTIIGTVIKVLAFPIYILTLGLISLVINGFLLWLTAWFTQWWDWGLRVEDFWWGVVAALLISVIGFVESVSVAQTLAAKRRQRIQPDQELIGLGAANIGAAFTGGYPVTGGFARSVVNFDAGAETPAAGAFTAVGLALAALFLTPLIYFLPKATLAATIIVAVLSLVDFSILKRAWAFSHADFAAVSVTILFTLLFGVEAGVTAGVATSILVHLYKTSRPHVAEVGLVPETHHFRNIKRHRVDTLPHLVTLRVDESLYFANARFLEDYVLGRVTCDEPIEHVVLMFPAVNEVDMSALETLEELNRRLSEMGIKLHLSEVKGPVMDRLKRSHFLDDLTGKVFLSQFHAWQALARPETDPALATQ